MRLGDDHFRVVTGGAHGMADRQWFTDHLRRRRRHDADRPHRRGHAPSACGGRGPATSSPRSPATTSPTTASGSSPAARSQVERRPPVLASRISYVGELGWELYVADGRRRRPVGAAARGRRRRTAPCPVGIGVYGTTGRIEKGYRAYGYELDGERTHRRGRHAAAEGQGGRLRRPGGLPRASARRSPGRPCSAPSPSTTTPPQSA